MGNTCNGKNLSKDGGLLGPQLEDFQNYSKPVDTLNKYDHFYRIVCYPIHCLQVEVFFQELDKLLYKYEIQKNK